MKAFRTITTSVVLATMALAPAAALAKQGADDGAGQRDDKGGTRVEGDRSGSGSGSSGPAGEVRVNGTCTGRSTVKLKAKPRDGRLEAEFEVDQNRNGVRWNVTISRNSVVAVTTTATTLAPSGSFSIERRLPDGAGRDAISARATSPTGEVCSAKLAI